MSDDNRFPADPAGILAGISTYGDLYEFLERNAYGNWDWEKKVSEVVVAALRAYTVPEEGRMGWRPMNPPPEKHGWYCILDAQDEPRVGLYSPLPGLWLHNSVEPLKAWCEFPPSPSSPPQNGETSK